MPLESCMILLDNSEYMRNGDYVPTRLEAQHDAANLLISHKIQSNPESTVGVIAMSGGCFTSGGEGAGGVELLVSPTDDMGKILGGLHGVPIRGRGDIAASGVDIPASVQVASLALKHRRNKNGQQRIVIFVGSPLTHVEKKVMVKAGKLLKKNNVAIDIVAMGELVDNEGKLKDLVDAANGSSDGERTCHLVTIPAGVLPSDVLVSSPIVHGGAAGAGVVGNAAGGAVSGDGGDAFADFGGVDPNMDPELAMALRVSMEEERARQERLANERATDSNSNEESKNATEEPESQKNNMDVDGETSASATSEPVLKTGLSDDLGDEDALLQQALAMSMAESQPKEENHDTDDSKPASKQDASMFEVDEDAAMQMALQMSMQVDQEGEQAQQQIQDPRFVNQLLGSLSGVDEGNPAVKDALENLKKATEEDKDKSDKKDDSKDED